MIPTYVLVHGSAGNASQWSAMRNELALRGHRSFAVNLPGRGAGFSMAYQAQDIEAFAAEPSTAAGVTGEETVGHVVDVIRQVREHGPVILVGHSLAGLTLTGVGNALPDLIDRLVYIAAQCPVDKAAAEYLTGPEWAASDLFSATAPLIIGNPMELGFIRVNWRTTNSEHIAGLRKAFGGAGQGIDRVSEQAFIALLNNFQPDEVFWQNDPGFDFRVDKDTWGRIPHTFIRLANDRSMPLAAQDRYINEADALLPDNPFDVHTVAGGHGTFLGAPSEVADILVSLD